MSPQNSDSTASRLGNRLLWAGLGCVVLGYLLLAMTENVVVSPILLVLGYCVLIPLHLWSRYRSGVGE